MYIFDFQNSALHQALKECNGPDVETEPRPYVSFASEMNHNLNHNEDLSTSENLQKVWNINQFDLVKLKGIPEWALKYVISPDQLEHLVSLLITPILCAIYIIIYSFFIFVVHTSSCT